LWEAGDIIEPLRDRIVGPRIALRRSRDYEGSVIVDVNQEITEELASAIQAAGIERVKNSLRAHLPNRNVVCLHRLPTAGNLASGRTVETG